MIFPIGDTQVHGGYKPYVSYTFIVINILVFILQLITPGNLICEWSVIPQEIYEGRNYITLLTSIFMHGSWMHLIGNMLFLWVFADNIEAKTGSWYFLLFYLAGGFFASAVHIYFSGAGSEAALMSCAPCSTVNPCQTANEFNAARIPSLGASGAISAVMGAYLVMFPHSKIRVLVIYFLRSFHVPALLFLALWFIQQLFAGIGSLGYHTATNDGVAWWAHIGGFIFGLAAGTYLRKYV